MAKDIDYRNLKEGKYYNSIDAGIEGYNPEVTIYYNASGEIVRKDETWRGVTYVQTVSGSSYDTDVTKTVTYSSWTRYNEDEAPEAPVIGGGPE